MTKKVIAAAALTVAAQVMAADSYKQRADSYKQRVALEVNKGRTCVKSELGQRLVCDYSYRGIDLSLTIDIREPQYNVFLVRSAPQGKGIYLKFGGVHSCAVITQYGNAGEIANVFISPRTGDIFTDWRVPECGK